ncbi:MAG: GNAT family N-acetyltransferase [Bacteroidota bacterium]|jgi:ribosomal protein S18 acetylase RimI-like enzyme
MVNVRNARSSDVTTMHRLIVELAEYEKAPQEVIATEITLHQALFAESPVAIAWVAELNNEVRGMAICYLRYSTWKGVTLYLEDLIVQEEYRQRGLGRALLQQCIQYAQEKNYQRVSWQVLDWNTPAIEFYKQFNAQFDAGWVNAWVEIG